MVFMERNFVDFSCFLIVFFVGLIFVFDLLGVMWAMIKKQPYKSMLGSFIERFLDYPTLLWLPLLIVILYVYGFFISCNF